MYYIIQCILLTSIIWECYHLRVKTLNLINTFVMVDKEIKHAVETVQKSNTNIVERGKIDTQNPQIHHNPLSWLGIETSIK